MKVKKGDDRKTYDVRMVLGSPYQMLVAVDGKPLSPDEKADNCETLSRQVRRAEKRVQSRGVHGLRLGSVAVSEITC